MSNKITRRTFVASGMVLAPTLALAQGTASKAQGPQLGNPPTVISNPPREWGPTAPPNVYPDPDVIAIDPAFNRLRVGSEGIKRLATGFQWCEGPGWNGEGQYFIFSDVKADVQYRYIWETGEVSAFRRPSYNSNGNTFDYQGRQVSCQHYLRRLVRWEVDGSLTVIADHYQGKHINSPDDVACHIDGSIWFTDPPFGASLSEGHPDEPGYAGNSNGGLSAFLGNAKGIYDPYVGEGGMGLPGPGSMHMELPANTYRWDPSGRLDVVIPAEEGALPNGICFSHDCKLVYFSKGPKIYVANVNGSKISNTKLFTDCIVDGIPCRPDGFRCDRAGNLWAGSTSVLGYMGVVVWDPTGKLLGRIRLPETCANLCFGGPKRDYLFMAASQSIYMLRVNVQGASPG